MLARLPSRSGPESRDPRGVPEAGLSGVLAEHAAAGRGPAGAAVRRRGSRRGASRSPLDIQDVWKNSYSASTNHKVWAAKFTARHPNLVALEISSFKCGHDAPIYTVIETIIERSGHAVFLVQGHRREQADRIDQDSRRDHRLLPEALHRAHERAGAKCGRGAPDRRL